MARSTTSRTGWWMANDPAHLWQNVAGTSAVTANGQAVQRTDDQQGSNNFLQSSTPAEPTWASPSGLELPALLFNGSNDRLNGPARTGIVSTTAKTILMAMDVLTDFGVDNANRYENKFIIGDGNTTGGTNRWFGIYGRTTSSQNYLDFYNWDGSQDVVSIAISLNTRYVLMYRHNGTNLYASINGGTESSTASGTTQGSDANFLYIGGHPTAGQNSNIHVGEVATYNAAITGTALSDTIDAMMADWVTAAAGQPFGKRWGGVLHNGYSRRGVW